MRFSCRRRSLLLVTFLALLATGAWLGAGGPVGDTMPAADAQAATRLGAEIYSVSCSTCHGFHGEGFPGIGKRLVGNEFVDELTSAQLAEFLVAGRGAEHPLNTTGREMPPRGGDYDLTAEELLAVSAFLKRLARDGGARAL